MYDLCSLSINLHRFASAGCDMKLVIPDTAAGTVHLRHDGTRSSLYATIHDLLALRPLYDALYPHFSPPTKSAEESTPPAGEEGPPQAPSPAGGPPVSTEGKVLLAMGNRLPWRERFRRSPTPSTEFEAEMREFGFPVPRVIRVVPLPPPPEPPGGELVIPVRSISAETLKRVMELVAADQNGLG